MSEIYPSTKALSVYNVLHRSQRERMSRGEVLAVLRAAWRPSSSEADIEEGTAFLVERGMLTVEGDEFIATRPGRPLKRTEKDRNLDWA